MTNGNINRLTDIKAVASEALAALDTGGRIAPFSARLSTFDLDDAYRVTAEIRQMREMAARCRWVARSASRIARFGRNMHGGSPTAKTDAD